MSRKKSHKDVEFAVGALGTTEETIYKTAEEASVQAVARSISDGRPYVIDVLVSSRAGAKWFGGDDAVEVYEDDPDASVHERIVVRAEATGRVA